MFLSIFKRIHVIGRQGVKKWSKDFWSNQETWYITQFIWYKWHISIKVGSSRIQQCFGPVNTLISKRCSETGVLANSSNQIFRNQSLRLSRSYEVDLFFKMFKILSTFWKFNNTQRKCWCFWKEFHLKLFWEFLSIMARIYVIGHQPVKRRSKDLRSD